MISFKKGLCLNTPADESHDESIHCDEEYDEYGEQEDETDEMEILVPSSLKESQGDGETNIMILPEEDPLFLPSDDDLLNPFYIDDDIDDSSRTSGTFLDDSLLSRESNIKLLSLDVKNPEQINSGGVESDSDSDVILVERNQEVIELSDDDANDCADLINTLNVPDDIIDDLKQASNKISLKLGELVRSEKGVRDIAVEIPTITWSLPWKVVSGIFKNPNLPMKSKRSAKLKKKDNCPLNYVPRKGKRKNPDGPTVEKKVLKVNETVSSNKDEMESTLSNIKKENESDRALSVIHFDPNKPPEFCEVSRSGRVIKKPSRLKDDVTFFRRTHIWKKRNAGRRKFDDSEYSDDIVSNSITEENDPHREMSDESFGNSIDSESCDRWMLGLNSDTEDELIDVERIDNLDKMNNFSSSLFKTNVPTSVGDFPPDTLDSQSYTDLVKQTNEVRLNHNMHEKLRRHQLSGLFYNLFQKIKEAHNDYIVPSKMPKIQILMEALQTISHLEKDLKNITATKKNLKLKNAMLTDKLSKLK